ncbi:MAG: DegT/DnrJ/EryC1/StrS family aminotransferase [Bryobacteraceae bacterium]|nr:DegT/DnrJ/EryC1/StrS family aminotransferase [Bryobacteraceae bacterium]
MRVPFVDLKPAIAEARIEAEAHLAEMFERGQFILGDQVAAFEREFARAMGARYAVATGTGTAALELCLREAGITERRMEVITTPLTAPFTALAIRGGGATPRFADVDPDSLLLDPEDAARRATRRTAALVPVHLYGRPCELDRWRELARQSGAVLVQDACQAHGALYRSKPLAAWSAYVAYSFYPTKNLGALGDGGAVVTDRARIRRRLAMLRDGGRAGGHVSRLPGINSRLDEMQACYLRAFLRHLATWNWRRARLAALYDEALRDCPGVRLLDRTGSVHHLYVIRVRRRERLRRWLASQGIGTAIHYPVPLHLQPAFREFGCRRGDLPVAERACREILSLPLYPHLPEAAVEEVAGRIRQFYQRGAC